MLIRACCIALLMITQVVAQAAPAVQSGAESLALFIWEDYFPNKVLRAFEKAHGIKVEQVHYETDELKDELLANTKGGIGLDLIVGSRASFRAYAQHGWLSAYPPETLKNLKHIAPRWLPDKPLKQHAVPYLWGTVGIAYRKDKVTQPITSWSDLFQPAATLKQRIMMINDSRDTIGLALKSLGYSLNSTSPDELKQAERLLLAQKPYVKRYGYPSLDESSPLVTGDIWVSLLYNGDALGLRELNENIGFIVPEAGTNLWIDDIAVLEQSGNKAAAWTFIDFINQPEQAAAIARHLNYATPNQAARSFLENSFLNDPHIYPSQDIIDKSEFFKELSPRQLKQRNDIFLRVLN